MAHDPNGPPRPATHHAASDDAHGVVEHADHAAMGEVHEHPTWSTYWKVALILTLITVVEVWVYYVPAFVHSRAFVPTLLVMSAVKFAIVVLFYMHLRYDHRLFRALFTGPLIIAMATLVSLLFLFGKLALRVGAG
jgi:cytochrome c oxidase subunit 4